MKRGLLFRLTYPIIWLLAGVLLTLLGPTRVRGWGRVPRRGGLLIVANHLSDVDPVVVQFACRRHVYFMAKEELFEMGALGPIIRWFGAFPVTRGGPDRASLRHAVTLLKAGEVVCVFPEGRISADQKLQPLEPGIQLIERMAGVPVIACGLHGTHHIRAIGDWGVKFAWSWVTVQWGDVRPQGREDGLLSWAEGELRRLSSP